MRTDLYQFAVVGGDLRQWYLADILASKGHGVLAYGLCKDEKIENVKCKICFIGKRTDTGSRGISVSDSLFESKSNVWGRIKRAKGNVVLPSERTDFFCGVHSKNGHATNGKSESSCF